MISVPTTQGSLGPEREVFLLETTTKIPLD